jgi:signal transduction histidine kinase
LARIRLGIERLADGPNAAVQAELERSIAELDVLVGEMLLTSRLDALRTLEHCEEVDLLALAAEEAAHYQRGATGHAVSVPGDPGLLRRMIRNLLDNAERHGGGATRIHVDASPAGVELIVEDHGEGVVEAERDRIFEPFYRSTAGGTTERGFGLGLAIVRQIARAHGGDVTYAPLDAGGSRFTVSLARH